MDNFWDKWNTKDFPIIEREWERNIERGGVTIGFDSGWEGNDHRRDFMVFTQKTRSLPRSSTIIADPAMLAIIAPLFKTLGSRPAFGYVAMMDLTREEWKAIVAQAKEHHGQSMG